MATVKLILKENKKNKEGLTPLYIRIIKDRKSKFISLGIYLKEEQWDVLEKKVKKHPNASRLNNLIANKVAEAHGVALELETKSKSFSAIQVKEAIMGKPSSDFFSFANEIIESMENTGRVGTVDRYKSTISKFAIYNKNKELFFDDLTVTFLKQYEHYLATNLGNAPNTIHANFKVIRKIINDAIREDVISIEKNPFLKYKMKTQKTERSFLTEEELELFENLELEPTGKKSLSRDMYVFAAYTGGLRISDILLLRWNNFNGTNISFKIQKTSTPISVKIPKRGLEIIEKYKRVDVSSSDFIFPLLDQFKDYSNPRVLDSAISSATAHVNRDLKTLAKQIGIEKNISFHTSRHTWATRALSKGMRIEYVSKLMGHSNIRETQIYAKIVNTDLDNAMNIFDN